MPVDKNMLNMQIEKERHNRAHRLYLMASNIVARFGHDTEAAQIAVTLAVEIEKQVDEAVGLLPRPDRRELNDE